jgi:hypothetical protein
LLALDLVVIGAGNIMSKSVMRVCPSHLVAASWFWELWTPAPRTVLRESAGHLRCRRNLLPLAGPPVAQTSIAYLLIHSGTVASKGRPKTPRLLVRAKAIGKTTLQCRAGAFPVARRGY